MSQSGSSESRLRAALDASHAHAVAIARPEFPLAEFETLQAFQLKRLASTYADLHRQPRFRAAVTFFLEELYGGLRFRERDRQVEQVLPVMVRLLPERTLATLADAFRVQALSIELDAQLANQMHMLGQTSLEERDYARIYPTVPRSLREEQLRLIGALGLELCALVRKRPVMILARAMRGPAHAAGFGALQDFLEQGLASFRDMGDESEEFVATILRREKAVLERLYAAEDKPFAI